MLFAASIYLWKRGARLEVTRSSGDVEIGGEEADDLARLILPTSLFAAAMGRTPSGADFRQFCQPSFGRSYVYFSFICWSRCRSRTFAGAVDDPKESDRFCFEFKR
jgi:hypothetical protein